MSDENVKASSSVNCQAKRGFFTLYDCGKDAAAQCNTCGRSLCREHFPQKLSQCLECEAKELSSMEFSTSVANKKTGETEVSSHHDLLTAYHKRDKSLGKSKGSSIYLGQNLDDYYQSYDLRSFDIELSNIANLADSPDEVFFDS